MLNYRAPSLAVDFLDANFPGAREEVQVLDVACGSGLVAKLVSPKRSPNWRGDDTSSFRDTRYRDQTVEDRSSDQVSQGEVHRALLQQEVRCFSMLVDDRDSLFGH